MQTPCTAAPKESVLSRILIVDDNPLNRELGASLLEHAGQQVMEANNGKQALIVAQAELPELILMDLNMPVMDGETAMRQLREIDATRHIPLVAVTGYPEQWERQAALDGGFRGYIEKPFRPDTFADDVLAYLQPAY